MSQISLSRLNINIYSFFNFLFLFVDEEKMELLRAMYNVHELRHAEREATVPQRCAHGPIV